MHKRAAREDEFREDFFFEKMRSLEKRWFLSGIYKAETFWLMILVMTEKQLNGTVK